MTAKNLLEKMGIQLEKQATFEINGEEFTFEFDRSIYDSFLNDTTESNKITPIKNFLLVSVVPEHREKLEQIIDVPDLAVLLMSEFKNHFVPKINITLKNSHGVLKA